MKRHQVVIVGGGPVGVGLAVELGLRGISCALVERRGELQNIPKGQNLTPRTLEHFYFWGVADELRADAPDAAGLSDQRHHRLRQPDERLLVRAAAARARAPLLFPGCRAPAAIPDGKGAARQDGDAAQCREPHSAGRPRRSSRTPMASASPSPSAAAPAREVLEADYVVGCDGAHSTVRDQIGIARGGADFDQLMVLAVFRSQRVARRAEALPRALDLQRAASRQQGLLAVLRPHRRRRGLVLPRAGAGRHHHRQFRLQGPASSTFGGLSLRARIRPCRVLGSARRRRREIPGRARLHRRRRRAQPSALWRLRPQ